MKKVALFMALFTMVTLSAKAQWFNLSNNMNDVTIGLNLGAVGYDFDGRQINNAYNGFGIGASFSLLGVYVDFIYQSPEHRWGNKISPMIYPDHTALTINAGYKIPVLRWLNVTPLIGYSNETTGWTDCSTLNIDFENHSVYHDYDVEHRYNHFNYGVGVSVKPIEWIEIGGVCTAHAVYGNISLNLMNIKD
jgi:hypothetical protein